MDHIRALEVFVVVGEKGSFSGAARALSISAPSVTRIINELENKLGAVLLHRTTRHVSLTEVGAVYLEDARKIVHDLEIANDVASGAYRTPKGKLKITASTLFGEIYVSPIITEYLDLYPDVAVEALFVDRVVNRVEEGIDVSVRIGQLRNSNLFSRKIGSVYSTVCGSPAYFEKRGVPESPEELRQHQLVATMLPNSHPEWRFADGFALRIAPRLVYTSMSASIAAARSGWGLTRTLSYQIGPDIEAGTLQTVLSEYTPEPLPIHLVYSEGRRASGKVRAFIDLASKKLSENSLLTSKASL